MPMSRRSAQKTPAWLTTVRPGGRADAVGQRVAVGQGLGVAARRPGRACRGSAGPSSPRARCGSGRGSARRACSVEVWISLTMPVPTTTVPSCTAGASRCSWSSSSARLFGTRTSSTSIRSGGGPGWSAAVRRPRRRRCAPGSPGSPPGRGGVGDLRRPVRRRARWSSAPQRSPTTTTVPGQVGPALREMPQQVLVGGVPGPQLVARVLGEAGKVELAPGRGQTVHRALRLGPGRGPACGPAGVGVRGWGGEDRPGRDRRRGRRGVSGGPRRGGGARGRGGR